MTAIEQRTALDVPFKDKDRAKAAGAAWDKEAKKWFAPEGADAAALAAWLPDAPRAPRPLDPTKLAFALHFEKEEKHQAKTAGARWDPARRAWFAPIGSEVPLERWRVQPALTTGGVNPAAAFALALQEAGLDVDEPIMDGKLRRVPLSNGRRGNLDGAYIGHDDGVASGFIQNFADGIKQNWTCGGGERVEMSPSHRAAWSAQIELSRARRDAEQRAAYAAAALVSEERWAAMCLIPSGAKHAYLERKGVGSHGVKIENGNLVVPARDIHGKLWTLQTIPANEGGKKLFVKDGRKNSCFHLLWDGAIPPGSDILFAEGYATGATLREATGLPVVVAFDAGNLLPVALEFAKAFPSSMLALMADDDRHGKANTGIAKAAEAAVAVGGAVVAPEFADQSSKPTDWNDLARLEGVDAVRSQVQSGLRAERGRLRQERADLLMAEMPSADIALPDCAAGRCTGCAKPMGGGFVAIVEGAGRVSIHESRRLGVELAPGALVSIAYRNGRADARVAPPRGRSAAAAR